MSCYGWSEQYVRTGLSSAKGQVFANWALENEMTMFGSVVERRSPGYLKQETKWQMARMKSRQS